jgi:hypothetical protein
MAIRSFAPLFKPTFRACDLASFLNSPDEKVELRLLFKYKPFSKYKPKQEEVKQTAKSSKQIAPVVVKELRPKDKELINNEWQKQLSKGTINFNDQSVLTKVNETITNAFLSELDDDSNETKMIRNMDFSRIEATKKAEPPLAVPFKLDYDMGAQSKKERIAEEDSNETNMIRNMDFSQIEVAKKAEPPLAVPFKLDYDMDAHSKKERITENLEAYKSIAKTTVYMERGNQLEKSIVVKLNEGGKFNFVKMNDLRSADFGLFKICGIPDGVDSERSTVVEVKTRHYVDLAKKTVCLRERVQCLCYLKLTSCKVCLLVESGPSGEQNVHVIEWDDDEFETVVVDKLSEFVLKYRKINEVEFSQIAKKYKYNQLFF